MRRGPGFKCTPGFGAYNSIDKKVLKPNAATWQYYRRKENGATYGTVVFEATRAVLTVPKVNAEYTANQVGIVSKEKIHFGAYNKLKITYISNSSNETGLSRAVFYSNKLVQNIPDNNANTVIFDLNNLAAQGATTAIISNPGPVAGATVVEYDISNIKTENYLYIHTRYVNNYQVGTGYLYIYDVEFY